MKKILCLFIILAFSYTKAQDFLKLPKKGEEIEFPNIERTIKTKWDLENIDKGLYDFSFFNGDANSLVLEFKKDENSLIFDPIKTNGKDVLVKFYSNGKIIHSYKDSEFNSGPNSDEILFDYSSPIMNGTYMYDKGQGWPIVVVGLIAACCVEVSYTYTSGDPPTHEVSVGWDCDCLSISLKNKNKIRVKGKEYEADYITYTVVDDENVDSDMNMVVSNK